MSEMNRLSNNLPEPVDDGTTLITDMELLAIKLRGLGKEIRIIGTDKIAGYTRTLEVRILK